MDDWKSKRLFKSDKLIPNSLYNAILYIENLYAGIFACDKHDNHVYLIARPPWSNDPDFKPRLYEEADAIYMSAELELYGLSLSKIKTHQAIKSIASKTSYVPDISKFKADFENRHIAPEGWVKFIKRELGDKEYADIKYLLSKMFTIRPSTNSTDYRRFAKILRDLGYKRVVERVDGRPRNRWKRVMPPIVRDPVPDYHTVQ